MQNKAGGYTGSSGDQADLDFSIVGAMQQPGFGNNASAPAAEAKNLVILKNSSDEEKKGAYEFIKYFTTPENQAKWSMETGYVAVRKSTQDVKEFKDYTEKIHRHSYHYSRLHMVLYFRQTLQAERFMTHSR